MAKKNIDDVLVMVQVRLQSERCPNKVIRPFAGSTLTDLLLEKLLASQVVPQRNIYLSVYEPELVAIGKRYNVNIFHRSKESAEANAGCSLVYEWWDKLPFKYFVLVSVCTPLLKVETIDNFVQSYTESESEGMFGVVERNTYFWDKEGNCFSSFNAEGGMDTKVADVVYEAAHCLYAGSLEGIGRGSLTGDLSKKGEVELVSVPEDAVFDINHEWEFDLYEYVYQHTTERNSP